MKSCSVCGEPSSHWVGERRLCCRCYVKQGNPPSDWHEGCVRAIEEHPP